MPRIQVDLYNFYGLYLPQLCARSFKEEETEEEEDGENCGFCVFAFSIYNSSDQFVSVIGYIVSRTRWSDT